METPGNMPHTASPSVMRIDVPVIVVHTQAENKTHLYDEKITYGVTVKYPNAPTVKDKKSKKSKNSKTSKSVTSSQISKTITSLSKNDLSSSKSSRKPKNINEEFWGFDLEQKEMEELNKNRKPVKVQLDPLQQRKERIKKLPKEMRIKILEEEISKLNLKVKHNFHVVSNILHSIFKSAMSENVPLFSEYYKEKFLYKDLVFQKTHQQYSNGNDEIELSKGIIIDEESTEIFLTKNQRWAQMYKLLTFQFCRDFAEKCKL